MSRQIPGFRDFLLFYVQSLYLYGLLFGGFVALFLPAPLVAKLVSVGLALILTLVAALARYRSRMVRERESRRGGAVGGKPEDTGDDS